MKGKIKEFKPTSWSINNKTSIYVLILIISIFGIINYNTIPKEQIPDIVIPTIMVNTIYPGLLLPIWKLNYTSSRKKYKINKWC